MIRSTHIAAAGLTLVEMLVVVALLAAMLGILLPALDRARALAHRTACMENQRTIGRGIQDHLAEVGSLPRARFLDKPVISHDPNPALSWVLLDRMRPVAGVFHCPGDEMALYPACGISYFYNYLLSGRTLESIGRANAVSPGAATLADVPLLWDADNVVLDTTRGPLDVPRFHQIRVALFADFHVQTASDSQTPIQ